MLSGIWATVERELLVFLLWVGEQPVESQGEGKCLGRCGQSSSWGGGEEGLGRGSGEQREMSSRVPPTARGPPGLRAGSEGLAVGGRLLTTLPLERRLRTVSSECLEH